MRAVNKYLWLLGAAIIFTSCNSGGGEATLAPTAALHEVEGGVAEDESPRMDAEAAAPDSRIPATWTPAPDAEALPAQQPALATRAPDESYVVQPGDTLAEIAEAFGVDLQRLASANNIQNIDFIFTGQVLTIPR